MKPTFFKLSLMILLLGAWSASAQMPTCMPGSCEVVTTNAVLTYSGVAGLSNNYAFGGTIRANAGGYTSSLGKYYDYYTNDDCQVINYGQRAFTGILLPTNCTWTASVWDWSTNGTGTNAVFIPASDGTGTLTFNLVWRDNFVNPLYYHTNSISAGFSVTNPPAEDSALDLWLLEYFGSLAESATNLDADGNTLGYDYTNNITPVVFNFTGVEVADNYVNTSSTAVQLDVAGSPYYVAVAVDDTNYAADAGWQTYAGTNQSVNLGSTEGWHDVWIGLRGHADATNAAVWQWKRLKLDYTPPTIVITNPIDGTVDRPVIQLQGFSPEALSSISYDLTNALGLVTNQQVLVLNQFYDTNTWEFTTNTFQAYDVPLTNGVNKFTFYATDLAGNVMTTNFSFTLDYSAKTNAPVVSMIWPQNGMQLCGSNVTLRGMVDDFNDTVAATITDTNGDTNTMNGLVERSGKFWLENLPLNAGTNWVSITISDVMSNTMTTNLVLVQSAMILTLNPVTDNLWQPTVNTSGIISDTSASVWVNGVQGTNNGDGTWNAGSVPVTPGGVASFDVSTYPPGSPDPAMSSSTDKPWEIFMVGDAQKMDDDVHTRQWFYFMDGTFYFRTDDESWNHYDHEWVAGGGGTGLSRADTYDQTWDAAGTRYIGVDPGYLWPLAFDGSGDGGGLAVSYDYGSATDTNYFGWSVWEAIGNEHCDVTAAYPPPATWVSYEDPVYFNETAQETYTRKAQTVWHVQTGGKAVAGLQNLCQFSASAWEVLNQRAMPVFPDGTPMQEITDKTQIVIKDLGALKADGNLWLTLPNDVDKDITPQVAGKDFYTFRVGGQKYESYFTAYVDMPGAPPSHATHVGTDFGHAWWMCSNMAPLDIINRYTTTNCSHFVNEQVGYADHGHLRGPGVLRDPESNQNIIETKTYEIGFYDMIKCLVYAQGIHDSPGIYNVLLNNCVQHVVSAGAAAGTTLHGDTEPETFGWDLINTQ